jgi:hypothetical protein
VKAGCPTKPAGLGGAEQSAPPPGPHNDSGCMLPASCNTRTAQAGGGEGGWREGVGCCHTAAAKAAGTWLPGLSSLWGHMCVRQLGCAGVSQALLLPRPVCQPTGRASHPNVIVKRARHPHRRLQSAYTDISSITYLLTRYERCPGARDQPGFSTMAACRTNGAHVDCSRHTQRGSRRNRITESHWHAKAPSGRPQRLHKANSDRPSSR